MKLAILLTLAAVTAVGSGSGFVPENPGLKLRFTQKLLDGAKNLTYNFASKIFPKFFEKGGPRNARMSSGMGSWRFAHPNLVSIEHWGGHASWETELELNDEHDNKKKGLAIFRFGNISNQFVFSFNKTDTDRLLVENLECEVNLDNTTIDLSKFEGATQYMRTLAAAIGPVTALRLKQLFCPQLRTAMERLKSRMAYYPKTPPLFPGQRKFAVDLSLTDPPKATPEYLEVDLSGYTFHREMQDRMAVQFDPHPLVDRVDNGGQMFYAFLSDETLNQFAREHYKEDKLGGWLRKGHPFFGDLYRQLERGVKKTAKRLNPDEPEPTIDRHRFYVSIAEAPEVTFQPKADKPKDNVVVKAPVELKFSVDGGSEVKVRVDAEVHLHANISTPGGKRWPRLQLSAHVSKATVESVSGDSLPPISEAQRAKASRHLKKKLTKHLKGLKRLVAKLNRKLDRWERSAASDGLDTLFDTPQRLFSLPKSALHFFRHTAVLGLDLGVDTPLLEQKAIHDIRAKRADGSSEDDDDDDGHLVKLHLKLNF